MSNSAKAKILLVEDHVDTLDLLSKLLRMHGYDVTSAQTKAAALTLCSEDKFDLLIGDLGLPDGDGLDLMHEIAKKCSIKGIAYTGYAHPSDIEKTRAAGFSAHISKPADIERLLETIAGLLTSAD